LTIFLPLAQRRVAFEKSEMLWKITVERMS